MRLQRDRDRAWLLDGAVGTELIARGLRVREECPEAWCLERPAEVRAIHAAYVAAGSEAVQTNTFGGTRPRLKRFGLDARQPEILQAAVRLAQEGAPGKPIIGSLGPTGETLPLGEGASPAWLVEAYAEAAAILASAGASAIHLETMFHPGELEHAIRGAREGAPGLPLIASMTLMPGASGLETPHGVPLGRMVQAVRAGSPDAVGVNCSIEGERMRAAVSALKSALDLPVWARPQAKISQKCANFRSSEPPAQFARHALELVRAGASAVGGCCGTGPAEIAALRELIDQSATKVAS
jgi:5-methyltetrahydrofolate--homocysteine methyltransferase